MAHCAHVAGSVACLAGFERSHGLLHEVADRFEILGLISGGQVKLLEIHFAGMRFHRGELRILLVRVDVVGNETVAGGECGEFGTESLLLPRGKDFERDPGDGVMGFAPGEGQAGRENECGQDKKEQDALHEEEWKGWHAKGRRGR